MINARQLAQHRKETVAFQHFEKALKIAHEFEEYLHRTHNHTDEEFARQEHIRY